MKNTRIFYGSESNHDLSDLQAALSSAGIAVKDNPSGLLGIGDIMSFKKRADSYIFIPESFNAKTRADPNQFSAKSHDILMSLFLLNSIFVSIQIGDRSVFYNSSDGKLLQKPLIIFDKHKALQEPSNPFSLLLKTFQLMREKGTISQSLEGMFQIATNTDELIEILQRQHKEYGVNRTNHQVVKNEQWQMMQRKLTEDGMHKSESFSLTILEELRLGLKRGVAVFTSASMGDKASADEALLLGEMIASYGLVEGSGIGSSGHMGLIHRGAKNKYGISLGWITPEVMDLEAPPHDADFIGLSPNIYTRMFHILNHSRQVVIGAGGRGGAGTAQEFMAYLLTLFMENKAAMYHHRSGETVAKPVIIDNANGIFDPLLQISEVLRLNTREHIVAVRGTSEVMEAIERANREAELPFIRSGRSAIPSLPSR